jgi:protein SCO1/2
VVRRPFLWHNRRMFSSSFNLLTRPIVLVSTVIAISLIAVIIFTQQPTTLGNNVPEDLTEVLNSEFETVSNLRLVDHNKDPFTTNSIVGKWSFIVFGYTNCPDVCPTTLLEIDDLALLLKDNSSVKKDIQYVFVSVDPERDTPTELASYLAYFDAGYVGVTGTESELRNFTDQVGVKFSYTKMTEKEYAVNHSSHMVLLDPLGRYVAHFSAPQYSSDIRGWFTKIQKLTL